MMEKRVLISHHDWSILFFILILSFVNLSSSQPNPPRNIETFYPGINTSAPSNSGASKKAIMIVIGATIASTFILVAFFILFTRFSSNRRPKEAGSGSNNKPSLQLAMEATRSKSDYSKLGKNVKEQYTMVANNTNGKKPPIVPRGRSSSSTAQFQPQQGSHGSGREGDQNPAFSTTTIPKAPLLAAPPSPPPVLEKKIATMPPPPPPSTKVVVAPPLPKTHEGNGRAREEASGSGNGQVKLKALHWEKLNINSNQTMVWEEIGKGSFQYNGDMMEALFNVMATNHKNPKKSNSTGGEASNSIPRIFILDSRKSQNIAIVIKSLGISLDELIDALLKGKGLVADILEKLTRMAPTREETSQIMAFNGDPVKLADAEFFLYGLLKSVPWAFSRVDEMLFRLRYDSEILSLNESLQMMELACNELKNHRVFLKLLEVILKAGNRLNAGTARGDAKAFNLNTLKKLSNFKSMDGKTTLLHFVVHEVVRSEGRRCLVAQKNNISQNNESSGSSYNDPTTKEEREKELLKLGLPVVGALSLEFLNVKKAASIDYDTFKGTIDSLARKVREARQLIGKNESTEGGSGFLIERVEFFESAEVEINALEEEHTRIMNLVKTTTEYFQAGGLNEKSPLHLFVIVKDFLVMVDQTCDEITRSSNQKKQAIVEIPSTRSEAS